MDYITTDWAIYKITKIAGKRSEIVRERHKKTQKKHNNILISYNIFRTIYFYKFKYLSKNPKGMLVVSHPPKSDFTKFHIFGEK